MVMNNHQWEEETKRFMNSAISELRSVEEKISEFQVKKTKLLEEINAYQIALKGYMARTGRQDIAEINWKKLCRNAKTQKEKLILIGKYSTGDNITQSKATDIFYQNKFTKARKRATVYAMVQRYFRELTEEGYYRKITDGEYRFIGEKPNLPEVKTERR